MRKTLKVLLLLTSAYYLNSCGSAATSTTSTSPASVAPTPNANGELVTTVNAETGATISASALLLSTNDPLSQYTSVEIPAGALSKATEVKMFEAGSLALQITPTDFGSVTEITKAGPTIVIQATGVTLTADVTVSVPYDASLSLVQPELAVVVLDGTSLEIFTGDQISVGSKTVSIKIRHFGAFQVVKYTGTVTQKSATVEISSGTLSSVTSSVETVASVETVETVASVETVAEISPAMQLAGEWVGGCFNETIQAGTSMRNTISIANNRMTSKTTMYTGLNCLTENYWSAQVSNIILGTNELANGARTITWTADTVIIPASLGTEHPCSTTWQSVGDTLECRTNGNTESYNIYKITDDTLCLGDWSKPPTATEVESGTISTSRWCYGGRFANEITNNVLPTSSDESSTASSPIEGTWATTCTLDLATQLYAISILVISFDEIAITKNLYSTDACTELTSSSTTVSAAYTDRYQLDGDQLIFSSNENGIESEEMYYRQ